MLTQPIFMTSLEAAKSSVSVHCHRQGAHSPYLHQAECHLEGQPWAGSSPQGAAGVSWLKLCRARGTTLVGVWRCCGTWTTRSSLRGAERTWGSRGRCSTTPPPGGKAPGWGRARGRPLHVSLVEFSSLFCFRHEVRQVVWEGQRCHFQLLAKTRKTLFTNLCPPRASIQSSTTSLSRVRGRHQILILILRLQGLSMHGLFCPVQAWVRSCHHYI